MGLAKATSPGVLTRAMYKVNWDFLSTSELTALYNKVNDMLTQQPMGLYNAVFQIFGQDMANNMVKKEQIFGPRNI